MKKKNLDKKIAVSPSTAMNCSTARSKETRSEKPPFSKDFITDGFDNYWHSHCAKCGKRTMEIIRPGDARCAVCD